MNSSLFKCEVMHHRISPRKNRFKYHIFMAYLDLDELDALQSKLVLFSRNRFNWFSFYDRHHYHFSKAGSGNIRENIDLFLTENNIPEKPASIRLLTNLSVFGYAFNPISVYICFNSSGAPVCSIAEVCNTHGEMKMYLLTSDHLTCDTFVREVPKHFYVSPYANLDANFRFIFEVPDDRLNFRVDDYENGKRFLLTSLTGIRKKLSDFRLLMYGMRFPLITAQIILLIHWQALILRLKRLQFRPKKQAMHLQQNMFHYK